MSRQEPPAERRRQALTRASQGQPLLPRHQWPRAAAAAIVVAAVLLGLFTLAGVIALALT